jgi:hypothetical protein
MSEDKMNIEEIIKHWLIENKYDGLYCEACGCYINDLFPCGEGYGDCVPAMMKECKNGCDVSIENCPNEYDADQRRFGYCMIEVKK